MSVGVCVPVLKVYYIFVSSHSANGIQQQQREEKSEGKKELSGRLFSGLKSEIITPSNFIQLKGSIMLQHENK